MFREYGLSQVAYRLLAACLLLTNILTVAGCTTNARSPAITSEEPPAPVAPGYIPVARQGRYTLFELVPTAAQQDLLLQVVDVSIPNIPHATVGDGLRHVLQGSGYQLCERFETDGFNTLPLPAAHYHLEPLTLRDALSTLVGPAWDLHVDNGTRKVCFTRTTPSTRRHRMNGFAIPSRERKP